MKKYIALLMISCFLTFACSEDNDDNIAITTNVNSTFNFTHHWDGTNISASDFNEIQFTNANGDEISIERLRYLISNITFTKSNGEMIVYNGYNLIDVTNNSNLAFTPDMQIPTGAYTNISFTFGFNNDDNSENYTDLNSASWNVPEMLGGGYHYMQLDGKFINDSDQEQGYNYHAIRAVDNPGNPTFPQDTFFLVNLGPLTISNNISIGINMNIAEWFKNPITWDLNDFNQMLMPNSTAQIMMYNNGQSVFSLGEITQ